MGIINENENWDESIEQVENGQSVDGGDDGPVVKMAKGLANRTLWLRKKYRELELGLENLSDTISGFNLSWESITGKPVEYPPTDHDHNGVVPVGGIIMWTKSEPPPLGNWSICNGDNGTPDLRDRFIVAAGRGYRVGDVGGLNSVSLTEQQNGKHTHNTNLNFFYAEGGYKWNFPYPRQAHGVETSASGEGQPHENRPPYYALFYIMRTQ